MKQKLILLLASSFLILALAGCGLLRPPEAASGTLEVIPLEQPTETTAEQSTVPTEVVESTPTQIVETQVESPTAPAVEDAAGGMLIYQILPGSSQVRFELDEDLRGSRITVVGTTDQVAGEMGLDFSNLASTLVGTIQINARTLLTDNNFRNRAIQNEILDTGTYEFVTFTPTAINGLPQSAAPGTEVAFTIDGDLTIRSITQPVTFTITAQAISDTEIRGTASATIQRADFDLNIPSVPNVANVEEEVELYIDFVATAS